ncbi:MAG: nucleotidyltransferase domain-containing protein [Ignavibacteriaceae bacterium]
MRLTGDQIEIIKTLAAQFFGSNAKVYLFGSRVDDKKQGGDIDIYIETDVKAGILDKKLNMLLELEKQLGQRKIDLVINNFKNHLPVYEVARKEGVIL